MNTSDANEIDKKNFLRSVEKELGKLAQRGAWSNYFVLMHMLCERNIEL